MRHSKRPMFIDPNQMFWGNWGNHVARPWKPTPITPTPTTPFKGVLGWGWGDWGRGSGRMATQWSNTNCMFVQHVGVGGPLHNRPTSAMMLIPIPSTPARRIPDDPHCGAALMRLQRKNKKSSFPPRHFSRGAGMCHRGGYCSIPRQSDRKELYLDETSKVVRASGGRG